MRFPAGRARGLAAFPPYEMTWATPRVLPNRVVDLAPAADGGDVAVHGGEAAAHRHDRDVAAAGVAPRRDVGGPSIFAAAILLNGFEAEGIDIPAERAQLGFDPR